MLTSVLIFTTDFDHPLIARVHYLVHYLKKRGIDVKVVNIPFESKKKGFLSYFKSILQFPKQARTLNQNNAVIRLPYKPHEWTESLRSITNILHLVLALFIVKITFRTIREPAIVAVGPLAGFVANFVAAKSKNIVYEDTDPWAALSKGRTQKRLMWFLETYCMKRAGLIISNSELLAQRTHHFNSNSVLISNGVDLSKFKKNKTPSLKPSLIYVGSIVEWAGLDLVVQAMLKLARKIPSITLNICGDGIQRPELEKLGEEAGLSNNVFFLGKVPYEKLQDLLLSSHVGIAMMKPTTFTFYASPLKLFEYMASGLPVVATDIGQLGRIVRNSGAGLSVKWDADELCIALEKLLTDKDLWTKCHNNGLQYVKNYDWNVLFDKWLQEVEKHVEMQNNTYAAF